MANRFRSIDINTLIKRTQNPIPTSFTNTAIPCSIRAKALHLEQKVLSLSGLELHKDIQLFDVNFKYKGDQFLHTAICEDTQDLINDNKKTLVLIPGYCGALGLYYPLLKDLTTKFRVYCVDLLGLGLSSRPEFECKSTDETIDYYVDSLEEWRKALRLEDIYIAGHSFGGYISAQYAAKYQNKVKGLYMFSPTGVTEKHEEEAPLEWSEKMNWVQRQFWEAYFQAYKRILWENKITPLDLARKYPNISKVCVRGYIQTLYASNIKHAGLVSNYLFQTYLMTERGSEQAIHHVVKPPRLGAHKPLERLILEELRLPTYCYYGPDDWVDWTGAWKIAQDERNKHFKFEWINNCGHQIIMQNPKDLCKSMLESLEK